MSGPGRPRFIERQSLERGRDQLGTLGSGNHFLEIGVVETIFDDRTAGVFGLFPGQVTLMLHSGSRGLGYQVCEDYLAVMKKGMSRMGLTPPDRQLACAMIHSEDGQAYLSAMACAANFAWANRQIMLHRARQVMMQTLSISPNCLRMNLLYDVCHNIAKKRPIGWMESTRLCAWCAKEPPGRSGRDSPAFRTGSGPWASPSLPPEIWAGPPMCCAAQISP